MKNRNVAILPLALLLAAACSGSVTGGGGAGGAGGATTTSSPTCEGELAPPNVEACGVGMACTSDSFCAQYPGNFCDLGASGAGVCSEAGCLAGKCSPTKVQGQACTRAAECYSGCCVPCPDSWCSPIGALVCAPSARYYCPDGGSPDGGMTICVGPTCPDAGL